MINNIFDDNIFYDDVNEDIIKYYYIDIKILKNILNDIVNNQEILNPFYCSCHLNPLIDLFSNYKSGEDIYNDSINNNIKINETIELRFFDKLELNKLLISLFNLFTLLKRNNINIYIRKLAISSMNTYDINLHHKLIDLNNIFKYLNLKLFDNISFDILSITGLNITDFKYMPDNINTIQFTSCNIQNCDGFPTNVKNVNFNYTALPNNFAGFPEKLNCLNLTTELIKYKYSFFIHTVEFDKKIIKTFIGDLNNLPYNLKIKECNIINKDYPDILKTFIKQYIKEKLKEHYKQDNLYKKLYRQLVSYKKI